VSFGAVLNRQKFKAFILSFCKLTEINLVLFSSLSLQKVKIIKSEIDFEKVTKLCFTIVYWRIKISTKCFEYVILTFSNEYVTVFKNDTFNSMCHFEWICHGFECVILSECVTLKWHIHWKWQIQILLFHHLSRNFDFSKRRICHYVFFESVTFDECVTLECVTFNECVKKKRMCH